MATSEPSPPLTLPSAPRRRLVALLAMLPWPFVLFPYLFVLPRYEKIQRTHNIPITTYTSQMIDVCMWARQYAFVAFAIISAFAFGSVAAAQYVQIRPMTGRRRTLWLALIFLLPCLLFAYSWLGVWITHRTIIEGLNR